MALVKDIWEAIQNGQLPGQFSDGGKVFTFPQVAAVDSQGNERFWEVRVTARAPDGVSVAFNQKDWLGRPAPPLPGYVGVIETRTWTAGGEPHKGKTPTEVTSGRNVGKANATNPLSQALRDALGLYNKKRKKAEGAAAAGRGGGVVGARPLPMLVQRPDQTVAASLRKFPQGLALFLEGATAQPKLNGVRLVARLAGEGGETGVELYSRAGETYRGMDHVRAAVAALLAGAPAAWRRLCETRGRDPAEGTTPTVYLDGELYKHGRDLRWISGEARGETGGGELEYWIFDCFFPQLATPVISRTRQRFLDLLFEEARRAGRQAALTPLVRVPNYSLAVEDGLGEETRTPEEKSRLHKMYLDRIEGMARRFVDQEGYEGVIIRKDRAPYQYGTNGYHSPHLIKVKPLYDEEFPVVGFTDGKSGKDVGAVIWVCEVPAGRSKTGRAEQFSVVPKNMTYEQRKQVFRCLGEPTAGGVTRFARDFAGKPLTVEYPELSSKTGIPTQAKALLFRTYDEGDRGDEDPLARLFRECKLE